MRDFISSIWDNLIYVLVGVIFINVLMLDYFTFFGNNKPIVNNINLPSQSATNNSTSTQTNQAAEQVAQPSNVCPNSCLTAIKTATSSLKLTQNITNNTTTQAAASSGSNEYFVPFGSTTGSSQNSYTTLSALQAYVNMSDYTNVQSVVFEVSITSPGIAWVQLYDATDGYVIPNSTVTTPGGNPQLLISGSLSLPQGNKLYQVQIQTQLSSPATISQARLHITLQ